MKPLKRIWESQIVEKNIQSNKPKPKVDKHKTDTVKHCVLQGNKMAHIDIPFETLFLDDEEEATPSGHPHEPILNKRAYTRLLLDRFRKEDGILSQILAETGTSDCFLLLVTKGVMDCVTGNPALAPPTTHLYYDIPVRDNNGQVNGIFELMLNVVELCLSNMGIGMYGGISTAFSDTPTEYNGQRLSAQLACHDIKIFDNPFKTATKYEMIIALESEDY